MAEICVIVPVYKVEQYLDRCVSSIFAQTFQNWELLLVDDGSPDGSGALCDGYAARDPRVHVIHQENGGLPVARNTGLDWLMNHSECQWMTFVDSDDWIHPEMLERMYAAVQETGTRICFCAYGETDGEDPWGDVSAPVELWTPKDYYLQDCTNATIACAKLYHRDCFAAIRNPVGVTHEDEFVTYRVLFQEERLSALPVPLYAYFRNYQGITKSPWSPKKLNAWLANEEQIVFFEKMGDPELVKDRYRQYIDHIKENLAASENSPARTEEVLQDMKKRARSLLCRAWKKGYIEFWYDYDLLCWVSPLQAKAYRLWLEVREKLGGNGHG